MSLTIISLGKNEGVFFEIIGVLNRERVPERIWRKDYTLWSLKPVEITNRLGWLDVMDSMYKHTPELKAFSEELRQDGISDVVLLGMGGSSLGAEVLNQVLGHKDDCSRLTVLDSTIPETVNNVRESIEPSKALFLVSSKSGTTAETLALFNYFHAVESNNSGINAGAHFTAITDPGSPLESLAQEKGFRRIFRNPEDIGGRYSVLSYFGLVPATVMGIDIEELLASAGKIRGRCGPNLRAEENEGCRLAAYLGAMMKQGRDKVTIITSSTLNSFGLWAEQLIAESTGKSGKGLVPITGEPQVEASLYGNDRAFVYLRLKGGSNSTTDSFIDEVKSAGQPIAMIEAEDELELGALFYLWEFAIAVVGMLIGIHPFNQPDVQRSKDATKKILSQYKDRNKLPSIEADKSLCDLLSRATQGDYFAIMAYIRQTPETDEAFYRLRLNIIENYQLATTLGYGPRFLHSTGQLHKGGPNKGLFLQVVPDRYKDIPVTGQSYSFGAMSNAEALGDLQTLQSLNRRIARIVLDPFRINDTLEAERAI